ncbi:flagellar hook-associated protein FlgK [Ferrimonas senticii]|uniref:flagellar hook-associated protein FlgK n=1 Tax=Ferrimonas senticii TaxID=394566 RepID=UPI0003FEF097|nr:flagellar hook-associated protein FlgK [Ferrimonas senticii]
MPDLMNIARSGVQAAQARINVASNNIANIGTDGYHRQDASQVTQKSERYGESFMGTGTYVSEISRAYNSFAERELTVSSSNYGQAKLSNDKLAELDKLVSSAGRSVPNGLNQLFGNLNNVADMPMDTAVRQNALTSAEQLADAFNVLGSNLQTKIVETNEQLDGTLDTINGITKELAFLNTSLAQIDGRDNAMLDQQSRLINQLAEYVKISVIPQESGVKSILMGGSTMLVTGAEALQLGSTHGDPTFYQTRLTANVGGNPMILAGGHVGGQLQALFDYRDQTIPEHQAQLSLMALGVADAFNRQQQAGFDLTGQVGQPLFTEINSSEQMHGRVFGYQENQGSKKLAVQLDDVNQLGTGNYQLQFDGTDYHLDGSSTPLSVDAHDPGRLLTEHGFSIRIDGNGAAAAGDRWQLTPTKDGSLKMAMTLTDPKQLAAAGYGLELVGGSGDAKLLQVDRSHAKFPGNGEVVSIAVDLTAGSFVYTDGAGTSHNGTIDVTGSKPTINVNGIALELAADSSDDSQFSLDLAFGPADNANAVAMTGLVDSKMIYGGSATLHDVYETMMTTGGSNAAAARLSADSAAVVQEQAKLRVQSESEVNLDEEAADLMRFQQAYQASARVMTVAKETFDVLFQSVR